MSEGVTLRPASAGLAGLLQAMQPGPAVAPPPPPDLDAIREAGWAAGFAAGEAAAAAGLAPLRAQLAEAAAALHAATVIDPDRLRPVLAELVRRIAETVLAAELGDGGAVLLPLVEAGLAAVAPAAPATLVAHPDTLAALAPHLPEIATRADAAMPGDAFRVEAGDFVIDTGLAARLAEILEAGL